MEASTEAGLPRGGMWERQQLYGGKRLRDEFASGEPFILWNLRDAGEVPVDEGEGTPKLVRKTILEVSREAEPEQRVEVGTLSSAIADMVNEAQPADFPALVIWEEVETSRGLNPATVLTGIRPYKP